MRMRSVLFTPGTRPDRVQKAILAGAADVVVADLEDAVAPHQKAEARRAVADALAATHDLTGSVRAVRINPWPSPLAEDDLEAVLPAQPELIVVPKAQDPAATEALIARLGDDGPPVLLILETAAGILRAPGLAAIDGVVAIAFGAEDLAADAGMQRTAGNVEVSVPRSMVALAAAAAGKRAVDMITADLHDHDRTRREAAEARNLGYAGKMCIHPAQVGVVHAAFAPAAEEVEWARRVASAVEAAGADAGGVVVVDGKMVDVPLIRQARRILADSMP